jgi:acetoacetate decarboxylase
MMPLLIGATPRFPGGTKYQEVTTVSLQFETSPAAVEALLPDCYQTTDPSIVTMAFSYNTGVEWMAGNGYRIGTMMVSARFYGKQDQVEGNYILVMFEDDTLPILLGRELLGVPKLYADISPIKLLASYIMQRSMPLSHYPRNSLTISLNAEETSASPYYALAL